MFYLYELIDESQLHNQYRFILDDHSIDGKIYVNVDDLIEKICTKFEDDEFDYCINKREPNKPFFDDYRLVYTFDSKEHFIKEIKNLFPEYFI